MKKISFTVFIFLSSTIPALAQLGNFANKVKNKISNKVNQRVDNKVDKQIEETLEAIEGKSTAVNADAGSDTKDPVTCGALFSKLLTKQ